MIHEYDYDLTVYINFVMKQAQVVSLWRNFMKTHYLYKNTSNEVSHSKGDISSPRLSLPRAASGAQRV